MASLTSNPMEEVMDKEEEEFKQQQRDNASMGYRRSWSSSGADEIQRPNTLRLASGVINVALKEKFHIIL